MRSLVVATTLFAASFGWAQTLTIAIASEPATFHPQRSTDPAALLVAGQVYETLVRVTAEGEVVPALAVFWCQPDPTTWRFELRAGVTFHDGSPFDAEAVAVSFGRLLDRGSGAPDQGVLAHVREVRAVDHDTVEIRTEVPFAPLLAHLAHPLAAVVAPSSGIRERTPAGTGPFAFDRWVAGEEVVLRANHDYWSGSPAIAEVVFRIVPEDDARVLQLRSGDADLLPDPPPARYAALSADPAIVTVTVDGRDGVHLLFNLDDPILADLRVRQAVAHGIDKTRVAEEPLSGLALPGVGPVPGMVRFAVDLPEAYPFDPVASHTLLAEAGYVGLRLRLDVVREPGLEAIAEWLRTALDDVGIELVVRVLGSEDFGQAVQGDDAQLSLLVRGPAALDADDALYAWFHSSQVLATNLSRLRDATVDSLLEQGRAVADAAVRAAVYGDVQEIVVAELPLVTLAYPRITYAKRAWVRDEAIGSLRYELDLRTCVIDE